MFSAESVARGACYTHTVSLYRRRDRLHEVREVCDVGRPASGKLVIRLASADMEPYGVVRARRLRGRG
jgi:hypothetical protein